eukprot:scaffold33630_cov90-Cyclotella_meneghiniana.AAC.1
MAQSRELFYVNAAATSSTTKLLLSFGKSAKNVSSLGMQASEGVAGTNEMQARYTPGDDIETCNHALTCEEEGRVDLLHKSIDLLEEWCEDNNQR